MKLTTHLQLVPRSKKCGSIHPLPHVSSWRSTYLLTYSDNFTFYLWPYKIFWEILQVLKSLSSTSAQLTQQNLPTITSTVQADSHKEENSGHVYNLIVISGFPSYTIYYLLSIQLYCRCMTSLLIPGLTNCLITVSLHNYEYILYTAHKHITL
jgi:hypothetical protein